MKYFAIIDGEQRGPYPLEQLAEVGVHPSTYVWCKGMADWERAEDVADVCRMFRNRIHDLMHPGSVDALRRLNDAPHNSDYTAQETQDISGYPTRFDRYLNESGALPSLEDIDNMEDKSVPPPPMLFPAIIVTILFFPFSGAVAIYFAVKSRKAWNEGHKKDAYDFCRSSKMWTGISFFLGLILYAFLCSRIF